MAKAYEELELQDDFMFGVIMRDPKYCKPFLETILGKKGGDYNELKKSYVIFICTFDPYGQGRHLYSFEYLCDLSAGRRLPSLKQYDIISNDESITNVDTIGGAV